MLVLLDDGVVVTTSTVAEPPDAVPVVKSPELPKKVLPEVTSEATAVALRISKTV